MKLNDDLIRSTCSFGEVPRTTWECMHHRTIKTAFEGVNTGRNTFCFLFLRVMKTCTAKYFKPTASAELSYLVSGILFISFFGGVTSAKSA